MEPITEFNLLSIVAKKMLGMLGQGQMMEVVRMIRWNLMEEAIFLLPFDVCSPPNHCLIMNIITLNCQGALKPSFQNHVRDLVQNHDLVVMIIMETQIGGDQARGIIDKLPFDGAIHTETIGFAGGLWLLWNSERVQVTQLAISEQEIYVLVKEPLSNFEFICFAVYASPRFHERCIL